MCFSLPPGCLLCFFVALRDNLSSPAARKSLPAWAMPRLHNARTMTSRSIPLVSPNRSILGQRGYLVSIQIHADLAILPTSTVCGDPDTHMANMLRHALLQVRYENFAWGVSAMHDTRGETIRFKVHTEHHAVDCGVLVFPVFVLFLRGLVVLAPCFVEGVIADNRAPSFG